MTSRNFIQPEKTQFSNFVRYLGSIIEVKLQHPKKRLSPTAKIVEGCKKRSISTHPKRGYPFTFLTRSS